MGLRGTDPHQGDDGKSFVALSLFLMPFRPVGPSLAFQPSEAVEWCGDELGGHAITPTAVFAKKELPNWKRHYYSPAPGEQRILGRPCAKKSRR